jgi:hypothetical protein
MSGLADRIRYALVNPLRGDHAIDPTRELANLLREVDLEPESGGGAVTFAGRDPIVSSPLPFATWRRLRLWRRPCRWRSYCGSGASLCGNGTRFVAAVDSALGESAPAEALSLPGRRVRTTAQRPWIDRAYAWSDRFPPRGVTPLTPIMGRATDPGENHDPGKDQRSHRA